MSYENDTEDKVYVYYFSEIQLLTIHLELLFQLILSDFPGVTIVVTEMDSSMREASSRNVEGATIIEHRIRIFRKSEGGLHSLKVIEDMVEKY